MLRWLQHPPSLLLLTLLFNLARTMVASVRHARRRSFHIRGMERRFFTARRLDRQSAWPDWYQEQRAFNAKVQVRRET